MSAIWAMPYSLVPPGVEIPEEGRGLNREVAGSRAHPPHFLTRDYVEIAICLSAPLARADSGVPLGDLRQLGWPILMRIGRFMQSWCLRRWRTSSSLTSRQDRISKRVSR